MKRILVANRGEIALRICKTIRKMGLESVAVFAPTDRAAPHTTYADHAVALKSTDNQLPYLDQEQLIRLAHSTGADSIHPGYGFLSENPSFSRRVREEGLIFIGPSWESIEMMGDKLRAKEALRQFNVPMIPGTESALSNSAEGMTAAEQIGFPVLVKAAAGGGGKGMRIVRSSQDFKSSFARARSEAQSAFGNDDVFVEKYFENPKHIEFQILADQHGQIVHVFERDCSVQRRHQKVIEEAPGPKVSADLRHRMGTTAIDVARSCQYEGAGTVEFLVDDDGNYYFLEMNTRLQVEHPVTEMISGLDLVEEQIRIARGERLRYEQEDLRIKGHAIELRIYAEDPENGFLPDVGFLHRFELVENQPGVRLDSGYSSGMEIPLEYDPLLAKLIVHGDTRQAALNKMQRAIKNLKVQGVKTTLPFGAFVCAHPKFRAGDFTTRFVETQFSPDQMQDDGDLIAARVALHFLLEQRRKVVVPKTNTPSR